MGRTSLVELGPAQLSLYLFVWSTKQKPTFLSALMRLNCFCQRVSSPDLPRSGWRKSKFFGYIGEPLKRPIHPVIGINIHISLDVLHQITATLRHQMKALIEAGSVFDVLHENSAKIIHQPRRPPSRIWIALRDGSSF